AVDAMEHFVSKEATWDEMSLGEKFLCIITMGLWKPMVKNEYLNNFRLQLRPGLPREGEKVRFGADFSDDSGVVIAIMDNGDVRMGCQSDVANIGQQGDCELTYRFEGKEARAVLDLLGPVYVTEPKNEPAYPAFTDEEIEQLPPGLLLKAGNINMFTCKKDPFPLTYESFNHSEQDNPDGFCNMTSILGELVRYPVFKETPLRINGYEFSPEERETIDVKLKTDGLAPTGLMSFLQNEINTVLETRGFPTVSLECAMALTSMYAVTTPAQTFMTCETSIHSTRCSVLEMRPINIQERYSIIDVVTKNSSGFDIRVDRSIPLAFGSMNDAGIVTEQVDHVLTQAITESISYSGEEGANVNYQGACLAAYVDKHGSINDMKFYTPVLRNACS
ncbi:EspG domain-containing protein, partial [Escherichia coli]